MHTYKHIHAAIRKNGREGLGRTGWESKQTEKKHIDSSHTHTYKHIYAHIHAHMHTYKHTYKHTCTHTSIYILLYAKMVGKG